MTKKKTNSQKMQRVSKILRLFQTDKLLTYNFITNHLKKYTSLFCQCSDSCCSDNLTVFIA